MHSSRAWLEPCYSTRLVQPFVDYLTEQGRQSAQLAQLSSLDTDARVPIRQLLSLLDDYVQETGRRDVGLRAAMQMKRGRGGLGFYAASSAPNLGEAVRALARYAPLLNESADFQVRTSAGIAYVELRARLPLGRAASDFQVAVTLRVLGLWLGHMSGFEAWFHYPEPDSREPYHELMPGVALRFNAPCDAVIFDANLLTHPLATADSELHAILVRQAGDYLARVPKAQTLAQRVRAEVLALMRDGHVDGPRVAAKLGMSRRSLTRHLEQEDTSYSELLNGVRRELALHMLQRTDLAVQEIAARLGYSLTAAFSRAFRRWEGMSPIEYRRAAVGDGLALGTPVPFPAAHIPAPHVLRNVATG